MTAVVSGFRHPARLVPAAFLSVILVGTLLLCLPISRTGEGSAPPLAAALFTAVSATCVTGLTTVDVATYWSEFGHVVILLLIQVGGFGIMTLATLLSLIVRGKLALRDAVVAQAESHTLNVGDVRRVLLRVATTMAVVEALIATVLTVRFVTGYGHGLGSGIWHGVFHSVSAFNNAGFSLHRDSLMGFVADAWICWPICVAIVVGGIGYPVIFELKANWHSPQRWSIHTRLTVWGTVILFMAGLIGVALFEGANPATLGTLDPWGKTVASVTGSVMPRTAGFNSMDYGQIRPETMSLYYVLMFVGGGSAGTAGGIKVTTFFLLAFVIWSEVRAERDVVIGVRRVPSETQRQALTVSLLGVGAVFVGSTVLLMLTDFRMEDVLFETISAFATVGVSTGITASVPLPGQAVLMILMFVGRVGTVTAASALALRHRHRTYRLPEERPIVG